MSESDPEVPMEQPAHQAPNGEVFQEKPESDDDESNEEPDEDVDERYDEGV